MEIKTKSTVEMEKADMMNDDPNRDSLSSDATSVASDKALEKKKTRRNIIRTVFDGCIVIFTGMHVSQRGPAFLDLQLISGTSVKGVSSYSTALNFGYMFGSLVAGFFYDRIGNKLVLICIPLSLASILISVTPLCTSYISMLLIHLSYVPLYAIPETTITADQLHMWQGRDDIKESVMQYLSFAYSLGGVLGPLYTEPFLAPMWNETDMSSEKQLDFKPNIEMNNVTKSPYMPLSSPISFNESIYAMGTGGNQTISPPHSQPESNLFYAYLITGIIGLLCSIPFYILCLQKCFKKTPEKKSGDLSTSGQPRKLALKPYICLTLISSVFFFLYTMIEDTFNMFLPMFVVSHLSWSKENGALISSLYWGIATFSKLLMVPIARRIDMGYVILVSCVGMVASLTIFVIASHFHIHILVWISSSCFSMSQASVFGGCFSWTDSNIMKMDGKSTSIFLIFAAMGAMAGPTIIGVTMEDISFMVFPYVELIESVICLLHFLFMLFFLKPYVKRKFGFSKPTDMCIDVDAPEEKKRMVTDGGDCDGVTHGGENETLPTKDSTSSRV